MCARHSSRLETQRRLLQGGFCPQRITCQGLWPALDIRVPSGTEARREHLPGSSAFPAAGRTLSFLGPVAALLTVSLPTTAAVGRGSGCGTRALSLWGEFTAPASHTGRQAPRPRRRFLCSRVDIPLQCSVPHTADMLPSSPDAAALPSTDRLRAGSGGKNVSSGHSRDARKMDVVPRLR